MKQKEGSNKILVLLLIPFTIQASIELFSLKTRDESIIKREISVEKEVPVKELEEERPPILKEPKPVTKVIQKRQISPPIEPKPFKEREIVTETIYEEVYETPIFETIEAISLPKEENPSLLRIFGLAVTLILIATVIFFIIFHLTKTRKPYRQPFFTIPEPSYIEDELKGLKQALHSLEGEVREIEKQLPGKIVSNIGRELSSIFEPKIRELGFAYQGIKKLLSETDKEINSLESLKAINFKDLARQVASELITPLQNEFNKLKISYENALYSFEERDTGRISSLETRHKEVQNILDDINKKLLSIESLITSATMFEQEPIIRTTKKTKEEEPNKKKEGRDVLNKYIYELADSGLSVDDIAQKTKIGKGEITLILELRKKE
ncbi:TPA: hypothetical protein DCX16_04015 [bacterium]|nr:hypothetical protein [bacterium]